MTFYKTTGTIKHNFLTDDLLQYFNKHFDTDIIDLTIYNYSKKNKSLYKLIAECNGQNIKQTDTIIKNELCLDDSECEQINNNNYVLIYKDLTYDTIVDWLCFFTSKTTI